MAKKTNKTETEPKEKNLVSVNPGQIQKFDPGQEIVFASKAAKALTSIIESKPKKVVINGQQYIEFEDWQTIARFFNMTVGTERTERIVGKLDEFKGYDATAVVFNSQGVKIGSAEASCLKEEKNWDKRYNKKTGVAEDVPEFQLKSMAQTRAMAKALRSILGWVVVLAGYKTTPAEEMDGVAENTKRDVKEDVKKAKDEVVVTEEEVDVPFNSKKTGRKISLVCTDCQKTISDAEKTYSLKNFKIQLCYDCQKQYKKKI